MEVKQQHFLIKMLKRGHLADAPEVGRLPGVPGGGEGETSRRRETQAALLRPVDYCEDFTSVKMWSRNMI